MPNDLKKGLLTGIAILLLIANSRSGFAQTLATYGNQSISREQFLNAFQKNNTNTVPTEKAYSEYLNLYINYRLKVKAAMDLRLDTLPNQVNEVKNFRSQIVDQYINDEPSVNRLVEEAFKRSQTDVHLQHIFISAPRSATPADTLKAWQQAQAARADLKKGKSFSQTAVAYSEDPFAKTTQGDLGYITVFSLPYPMENIAYALKEGKVSSIYRSPNGYHIFKSLGQRKALGKIRIAQILLVFPQHPDSLAKLATRQRADSLYQAIQAGANFSELAKKFSGDNLSFQSGGEMPEFTIGKYNAGFENAAFALAKDGEVGHPIETAYGYHIIKRIKRKPVPAVMDKQYMALLKEQVTNDPRIEVSKREMYQTVARQTALKDAPLNMDQLWSLTDSALQNRQLPVYPELTEQSTIFSFPEKTVTVKEWLNYRKSLRSVPAQTNGRTAQEIFNQYRQLMLFDYYKSHLEKYNRDFAYQVNEFKDGNLLFEIMQRNVWDKASQDSTGLRSYFNAHADDYAWNPSADAILFTTGSEATATLVQSIFTLHPGQWRRIQDSLTGQVQTDSGRFELKQLPGAPSSIPPTGRFTDLKKNPVDQSIQFAFMIKGYPDKAARSFEEARGLVINDYQTFLENKWVETLAVKYPVKINEKELKSLHPAKTAN